MVLFRKNTTHVELGFSLFSMRFGANGVVCRTDMVSSISVLVGGSVVVWWSPSLQVLLFPTEVHFTRCFFLYFAAVTVCVTLVVIALPISKRIRLRT